MSISERITSIENHLTADYEGIANLGIDLTNVDKNIQNIRTCLDTVWNNLPKVTGEDTEVTLTPTLKGKLGIVEKGNSTQDSTTGKNLFSGLVKGRGVKASTGVEQDSDTSAVSDYIPVNFSTNSNYYLSGLTDTLSTFIWAYNSSKQGLNRTSVNISTTVSLTSSSFTSGTPQGTGDIAYIRVQQYYNTGNTGTIDDIDNLKIMLNTGNSAETYEPYTRRTTFTKSFISTNYKKCYR